MYRNSAAFDFFRKMPLNLLEGNTAIAFDKFHCTASLFYGLMFMRLNINPIGKVAGFSYSLYKVQVFRQKTPISHLEVAIPY